MTVMAESWHRANALIALFDIQMSWRSQRGRRRLRNADDLNDRLLADIGLTRALINGFPEHRYRAVVRPSIVEES